MSPRICLTGWSPSFHPLEFRLLYCFCLSSIPESQLDSILQDRMLRSYYTYSPSYLIFPLLSFCTSLYPFLWQKYKRELHPCQHNTKKGLSGIHLYTLAYIHNRSSTILWREWCHKSSFHQEVVCLWKRKFMKLQIIINLRITTNIFLKRVKPATHVWPMILWDNVVELLLYPWIYLWKVIFVSQAH